ncbi:hypothetical protein GETHOR_11570 [Geothrix oryzae]|uniref:Single Cache domain-containing protein n=2 Tax=Geothrix oryzae TaxID=2927975 RepID=A0ABN6UWB3_9BACT|nr:hypothetical protein GETHOR_11570 [Geothrix oryzae]
MHAGNAWIPALFCMTAPPLLAQDQPARALSLVKEAVAFAKSHGKEALLREINHGQGRFHVKSGEELYIFVYDLQGVCQAIGFQSQMVGTNRIGLRDPDGKHFLRDMIAVARAKGSGWVDYKYPHPATGKVRTKVSYVELMEGWIIGCGAYK